MSAVGRSSGTSAGTERPPCDPPASSATSKAPSTRVMRPCRGRRGWSPRSGRAAIPFRFVTNTTSRSRRTLVARLATMGIVVSDDDIVSAPVAGAALLRAQGHDVVAPFLSAAVLEDLEGLALQGGTAAPGNRRPTAILVGDLGEQLGLRAPAGGVRVSPVRRGACHLFARPGVPAAGPAGARCRPVRGRARVRQRRHGAARGQAQPGDVRRGGGRPCGCPAGGRPRVLMLGDDMHSDIAGAQAGGPHRLGGGDGKVLRARSDSAPASRRTGSFPASIRSSRNWTSDARDGACASRPFHSS